ncbi:MAG: DnaJ domain-containing protein [Bacteroidetes bacterium]|nr:DnaJ domain-containing protein [Bacteroidota bacterium]MBT6834929.1 DnaJ domain-containing protein [Bacteroidota bacterium]MBT7994770.1 DnaJ domain-containing protein [Bacteroidota bacterium]
MAKYAKWIGGGVGWALGGVIGGLIGFALGSAVDGMKIQQDDKGDSQTRPGDFAASLLVLSAAVMKADGRILKSELEFVKSFFKKQFGESQTLEYMQTLRKILIQEFSTEEVCSQIRHYMDYSSRVQLLHYLFGIAKADQWVDQKERKVIQQIGKGLGINQIDFDSVQAMFYKDINSSYKILEVDEKATAEEIKKAYRKMAVKFHPDKVAHLGEEFQKAAKEKFQKVNEAYESLKKEKNFN